MRLNRLRQFHIDGTTNVVVGEPMLEKPVNYWGTSRVFPFGFCGEGVYFEDTDRHGSQFEVDAGEFEAGVVSDLCGCKLSDTLVAVFYKDGSDDKGKARAGSISGTGAITWGTVKEIEAGATSSTSIVKMSATSFAVAYADSDDSVKVKAVACTVSGTTITAGTAVAMAAAIDDTGTAIVMPTAGIIVVGYALGSDHKGYGVASLVTGTVVGASGTPVEFEAGADMNYPAGASVSGGKFVFAYQDGAATNDPATVVVGDVSTAGVVTFGTAVSMAGAAAAGTSFSVTKTSTNEMVIGWIDSTFGHVRAGTVADTTVTFGDELAVTAAATLTFSVSRVDSGELICAYEADAASDIGKVSLVNKSVLVLTTGQEDVFSETAVGNTVVIGLAGDSFVLAFMDDAASDEGVAMVGKVMDHLIDVRSSVTAALFDGYMLHKNKDGLGQFAAFKMTGTTNATANTAMSTKPVLPWRNAPGVWPLFKDQGMYIEDDGSDVPYFSGVSASGRTIDVRSTTTAEVFECYMMKVAYPMAREEL